MYIKLKGANNSFPVSGHKMPSFLPMVLGFPGTLSKAVGTWKIKGKETVLKRNTASK